jgi:hypothetical protein
MSVRAHKREGVRKPTKLEPSATIAYTPSQNAARTVGYLQFDTFSGVVNYSPSQRLASGDTLDQAVDAHAALLQLIGPYKKFSVAVNGAEVSLGNINTNEIQAIFAATETLHRNCTEIRIVNPNMYTKIGYAVLRAVDTTGLANKVVLV